MENLPFIHIDVARNITREFIENSLDKYFITPFCTKHNINLSRLGKYQFSALCFKKETVTSLDPNAGDCFNITPSMLLINNMEWKHNIDTRDKYGNNILHYYNFKTHGWMLTYSTQYNKISSLAQYSEEELLKLLDEENVFGCTAKEVAFSKNSHKIFPNIEKKVFNYSNFSRTCGNSCFRETRYLVTYGQLVDMRILYATRNEIKSYNYDDYKDIEYRDENGKHLAHDFDNCLKESIIQGLRIPLKDIVYCKDANQTMPIQTCYWSYYLIIEELARFSLLNTNFVSYSDNFGMYRIMYLLLRHSNLDIIFTELKIIGFDYSQNIPQLVSLFSESKNGLFYFSIERSELKQLKNVSYFGSCDGDDFSNWIIRYCLHIIESADDFYHLDSLLQSLFKKGLRLDIVRNSLGKTAFDILQEFKPSPQCCNRVYLIIKNICKRKGVQNKSKALSKFILKYDSRQNSFIQKETETEIIASACVSVQLIRTTTNK